MPPPMLAPDDQTKARELVSYFVVFYGFAFILIFGRSVELFLQYPNFWYFGPLIWAGIAIFFGVHAVALVRILLPYTKYDLFDAKDYRDWFRQRFWSFLFIFLSHTYCVLLPFGALYLSKNKYTEIDVSVNYAGYFWLDFFMLGVIALMGRWHKVRQDEAELT